MYPDKTYTGFYISSQKEKMQIKSIHDFLCNQSYWAKNITMEVVKKSITNSLCVGAFKNEKQIGFARIITDYATFAYLADVYVLPEHREEGISKAIMQYIMELDFIPSLRRFLLATLDAHGLYAQYGFTPPDKPEALMQISKRNIYGDGENKCN